MRAFLSRFLPELTPVSTRERLRSAAGALVGILATGLVCRASLPNAALPILIAPMGASAVLLFAVPASPLAQPWSILGGNLVAALVGVTAAAWIADPFVAAACAIGVAIALMMLLRCLHPPSGAVALTAVLGGPAVRALGYGFALWPVAANSLILLATALLFNNLTGRAYPHQRPAGPRTADPPSGARVGFRTADLDAALKDFDQLLDVDRGDLEQILRQVQMRVYGRSSGPITCGAIMSRDVIAVAPDAPLTEALRLLRRHRIKALPVTDEGARVLGIVTQTDLLDKAAWDRSGPRLGLGRRLRLTVERGRAPHGCAADIMSAVAPVGPDLPIAALVPLLSRAGLHHLPVVDRDGRLVGIVSQTDLIPALLADAGAVEPPGRTHGPAQPALA
ncbi:HPP family protein [Methylobacterium sp. J-030]|uniref:HPP family protein n=1 Tax=Methylobacterium sp. J-030 TaxID=2836627 RepID=UPI001FB87B37|nr:HPP family protein [Methylobacterium sp. J-030]MCJ2071468.1 HPP family protein [Methylobacterium sp. J-030]